MATTNTKYGLSKTKYVLTTNPTTGLTTLQTFTRTSGDVTKAFKLTADSIKTYTGLPNGVIYSYNDIGYQGTTSGGAWVKQRQGGVSGTVANSVTNLDGTVSQANNLTIVTRATVKADGTLDTNNSSEVNIDGNILYADVDKSAAAVPANKLYSGILGIVSGQIRMVDYASVQESSVTGFVAGSPNAYTDDAAITDMSVHATLMAYDTISVDDYASRSPGEFRMIGGYIARNGAKFGQLNGGTGPDALDQKSGFRRILNYDKRVANTPPPYFPGTGQTYEVISYQRVMTPLQN